MIDAAVAVLILHPFDLAGERDEHASFPRLYAGDEQQFVGERRRFFKSPVAVAVFQQFDARQRRTPVAGSIRIVSHFDHPKPAKFIKADRHRVDDFRFGGDKFEFQTVGKPELLQRRFRTQGTVHRSRRRLVGRRDRALRGKRIQQKQRQRPERARSKREHKSKNLRTRKKRGSEKRCQYRSDLFQSRRSELGRQAGSQELLSRDKRRHRQRKPRQGRWQPFGPRGLQNATKISTDRRARQTAARRITTPRLLFAEIAAASGIRLAPRVLRRPSDCELKPR